MIEKTILLFDIDATLTPPRQPINKEMVDILSNLNVPFAVAAGSHMELLQDQFFKPLFELGFRGVFDAYVSNGPMQYHCDYTKEMSVKLAYAFNIREYLGEEYYQDMIRAFNEVLEKEEFALPPEINILPEKITDRGSMINFITMGRAKIEGPNEQESRKRFVEFSESTGYRNKVIEFLNQRLAKVREEKGLKILLGGQTSFDIVIDGYDKTYPLRKLVPSEYDKAVFIGDALFPGGNDYVVQEFIEKWDSLDPCPYEAIKTESWENTIEILKKLGYINKR